MNAQRKKIILAVLLVAGAATAAWVWFSSQPKTLDEATAKSVQELAAQGEAAAQTGSTAPADAPVERGSARKPIKP
jgi:hypothetical protein